MTKKVPSDRCDPISGKGFDEKSKKYTNKVEVKSVEEFKKEINRLDDMKARKMKPELLVWVGKRSNILTKLLAASEKELWAQLWLRTHIDAVCWEYMLSQHIRLAQSFCLAYCKNQK